MKSDEAKSKISRRDVLLGAGYGAAVTGTVAAAVSAQPAKSATDKDGPKGKRVAGYRETAHVRQAYALARF